MCAIIFPKKGAVQNRVYTKLNKESSE